MGTRVDFTVPGDATVTTTLKAVGALFVDNIEIDTTNAITNQTFVFNGTKFIPSFSYSPSGEPIGFQNRTDSTISFTNATRTFSISPTAASFVVWNGTSRYVKTTTETVVISNTSALHFIYYDAAGVLSSKTTPFVLSTEAPVACVYWNATDSVQYLFAEERHGITLDWQTHEYLHRTRGAAYASGFDAANYTISGTGSSNADAQIDILNGVFFDEDIEVSVSHAASPVANTWQQRLQGGAYIPAFYKTGAGVWKKDTATQYPLKVGVSPRACYNLNTAGTWTTPELGQNKYGISWLVATNNLNEPVIAILGQAEYNNQGDAEAVQWGQLDLGGFPVAEFRPLYKVIYQTSTAYANTPKARFTGLSDLRSSGGTSGGIAVTAVDHGALTGLADDDHPQYILADGTRGFTAPLSGNLTISGNLTVNGTTTTINSTVTTIDDPIITLGGDTAPTVDDNKDRGIEFRWHNGTVAKVGFFGYDDSTGKFTFIPDATNTSEVFSGTKGTLDAFIDWADITSKPDFDTTYVNATGDTMTGTLTVSTGGITIASTGQSLTVGTTNAYSAKFSINTVANNIVGAVIRGASPSQTANLQEWQNSAGASLVAVTAAGNLTTINPIISTVTTGTAPFTVASTTLVTNLNANSVEGQNLAALDTRFINTSGDTMTGTLTVTGYGALVSTTPTQGSSVSPFGTQSISASPFSRQWADVLRWRLPTLTETSVDGTTFTTSTSTDWTHRPFIGDVSGTMVTVPALDGSTTTSVRWTWGTSTLQYSAAAWLALAVRYSLPAPVITAIWETSPDGTTWTTQATAASVTATNRWSFIRFDESATSIVQNRITIKREAGTVYLTSVQWLTPRPGDQGTGANRELPFTFGVGRNIILQPTLATSTPLQVRGASGHTSSLQRWEDPTGATAYLQVLSDGRLQSTLATGTAPLVIASTTLVTNLNADLLDGQDGTYYTNWTNITNKPSPVITLAGDLTGNVTLTNLTNASLTATISPNSVDLGVDTTGNYVATIASGETNGITVSGSGTETAAVTLFLPQALHASAAPTFSRAVLTQATGTAPLTVTSTTVVGNLNADLLDGQHGSWYQDWTNVSNKPSPSITLTGDVTGVATLTSLTSASISATVSSNASALSASNLLTKILTVDGSGSLLDADLLDGNQATFFASQAALEAVLGDLLYVGLYDAKTYSNTTPSFRVPNPTGTNVNYLSLASAAPPADASIDFRVDCIRPANDTTINRRPFQWNNFFIFTNGALNITIASSISTFPGHTVTKATLDAITAVGNRIQLRLVWDAATDTLTSFARAATGNSTLPLTDNTGWTQVGTSTHTGIILSNTSRTPYIGYGDSNSAFDGHIYGVAGYVNASLTYNILPTHVGNIKTVSTFTAGAGGTVTVVRGGGDQTELVLKTLPIPTWTGSTAAGGSATANTTYRNAMYWVVASTGDLDFVDADLSGRYDYGGQDATVGVANGDWVIALKSGGGAGPNEDLSLSQITFQVLPFSSETFVRSVVQQHQDDVNDPHAAAGYLMRSPSTTLNSVTVYSTQRSASAASVTTSTAHGLIANDKAYISGVGASYDGTYVVNAVPSTTVFTYATTVGTAASALAPTGATAGKLDDRRFADVVFAPKEHNHNTDIQTQIAAHAAAADPHPIYLTQTEANALYSDINHLHSGVYEVAGTMAAHLSRFDHTSWLTRGTADGLYLGINTTFDTRYYLKTEVDSKIAGIAAEVYATDSAQSARIFIGSTEPSSATVQRGDLWIETNNIALVAPSAPTNFAATAAGASVTLGWSAWPTSVALTSLTLEWALNSSFTGASSLPATPATITSYTHTGLTENTLYYYRLRATNAAGTGPNASVSITSANVAPPTPTISASAVAGTANIQATFSAAAYTDAPTNRFIMYLNNASAAAVSASPYTFTGLTEGVSYTVGVQTVDTGGLTSPIVNASAVTTNNIAPPAPASASATVINNNQIQATWPAVSITDFSNYQVQPFFSSNSASAQAAQTTTNTNYTFTGLAYSTGYFVRVWTRDTASNQSASFAQSASVTTTASPDTTAPAEATITSFKPETSYGNMVLRGNWPSDADFTSATIERSTDNTTWTVDQSYTSQTPGASFSRTLAGGPYASGQTVYARVKVTDTTGNTRTGAAQSYTLVASPSFITADATNSWRNTNGGQYNVNGNFRPYQGFFSNAAWNAIGFWYYGTKPNTELSNSGRRTITSLRFFIVRWDAGGSAAMNPVFALHNETTNPGTVAGVAAPTLYSQDQLSSIAVTTVAGGANTGYTTLPTQWGIDLVAGTRRGVAVYDSSSPVYANFASVVDNGFSGLLEFTHLG